MSKFFHRSQRVDFNPPAMVCVLLLLLVSHDERQDQKDETRLLNMKPKGADEKLATRPLYLSSSGTKVA